MSVIAYIGIGSNVGDRAANCRAAVRTLERSVSVLRVSSLYCTEPVGYDDQEDFINAVVEIETELTPQMLLGLCRTVEAELGRVRTVRWGPRTIDLDILLYGTSVVDEPELTIPHPRMAGRRFVLMPLAELAPDVLHPVLGRTAAQLLGSLGDGQTVERCRTDRGTP